MQWETVLAVVASGLLGALVAAVVALRIGKKDREVTPAQFGFAVERWEHEDKKPDAEREQAIFERLLTVLSEMHAYANTGMQTDDPRTVNEEVNRLLEQANDVATHMHASDVDGTVRYFAIDAFSGFKRLGIAHFEGDPAAEYFHETLFTKLHRCVIDMVRITDSRRRNARVVGP